MCGGMKIKYAIVLTWLLAPLLVFAQQPDSVTFTTGASYTADMGRNFAGGIKSGNFYLGMINLSLSLSVYDRTEFYLQVQNTHGSTPSAHLTGDLQTFSNIENGNYTYLYMAWVKHSFGKMSATFGIHDLNSVFYVTEHGALFLNSSFGIQPSCSWNMPVSIFPKNTLGLIIDYQLSDNLTLRSALYDGDPGSLTTDRYNLDLTIDIPQQGLFGVTELQYNYDKNKRTAGTYKVGYQYLTAKQYTLADSTVRRYNAGLYVIADQHLTERFGLHTQLGWSPSDVNINSMYASLGACITGIGSRKSDVAGMAVSYANLSDAYCREVIGSPASYEAAIEVFYRVQLSEQCFLQPDFQYIVNPGAYTGYANAWVGFVRVYAEF